MQLNETPKVGTKFFFLVELARIMVDFIPTKVTMEMNQVLIDQGNTSNWDTSSRHSRIHWLCYRWIVYSWRRSTVVTMVDHLCTAIGASRQTIMAEYDARTDEALSRLASTLPTAAALDLLAKLDEAYAECHLSWKNVLSGSEPAMQDQPPPAPRHARGITPDDGDGDEEHPHSRKRTKIQGVITACLGSGIREGLLQMHENEGSWAARTRLAELGDSSVDHTWLWRLNPRHGLTLEADEYIDSVRFRLGCAGPVEPRHLRRL